MNPISLKKLHNPTDTDFTFQYGGASYTVKAASSESFVDFVALHGAMKMADLHTKSTNPDEKKVLIKAYLDNVSVEKAAETLGVKLDVILAKAVEKGKEKARMNNLEAMVEMQNKKIEMLMGKLEEKVKTKEKSKK